MSTETVLIEHGSPLTCCVFPGVWWTVMTRCVTELRSTWTYSSRSRKLWMQRTSSTVKLHIYKLSWVQDLRWHLMVTWCLPLCVSQDCLCLFRGWRSASISTPWSPQRNLLTWSLCLWPPLQSQSRKQVQPLSCDVLCTFMYECMWNSDNLI